MHLQYFNIAKIIDELWIHTELNKPDTGSLLFQENSYGKRKQKEFYFAVRSNASAVLSIFGDRFY